MTLTPYAIGFLWFALAHGVGVWVFIIVQGYLLFRDPNDFSLVKELLNTLLRQGFHGADYKFLNSKTGHFLRVRKYIKQKSVFHQAEYGLELVFPLAGWHKGDVEGLKSLCADKGLDTRMMTGPLMSEGALIIDFGRDVDAAYETCRSIWTGLFGLTERTTYQSKPYDLLAYDALVDRLDYPRPTPDETLHHRRQMYDEDMRKIGKRPFSCWHVLGMGALVFVFGIAVVGLPANLLLTHTAPPDWQIQLGDAVASGSLWGAVFFLFHLTWLVWINIREKEPRKLKHCEKIMKYLGRTTFHITPFAVLIVWLGL